MKLKNLKNIIIIILLLLLSCTSADIQQEESGIKIKDPVNDYNNLLTHDQIKTLNEIIRKMYKKSSISMAVLIIDSTEGQSIESYALKIIDSWKIKKINKSRRVLFIFAMNDRKLRIEYTDGLNDVLTDEMCQRIVNKMINNYFMNIRFYEGIKEGLSQMSEILLR